MSSSRPAAARRRTRRGSRRRARRSAVLLLHELTIRRGTRPAGPRARLGRGDDRPVASTSSATPVAPRCRCRSIFSKSRRSGRRSPPATPTTSPLPAAHRHQLVDDAAARPRRARPRGAAGRSRAPRSTSGHRSRGASETRAARGSSATTVPLGVEQEHRLAVAELVVAPRAARRSPARRRRPRGPPDVEREPLQRPRGRR